MLDRVLRGHRFGRQCFVRMSVVAGIALTAAGPVSAQSLASYGATGNQIAVGAALDAASSGSAATLANAIRALPDAAARADALGQVSARSFTLMPMLAIQSLDAVEAGVHNHLVDARDREAETGQADVGALRLTLMGDLRQAHYSQRPDRPRATSDSRSLSAAVDYAPLPGVIAGVTVGADGVDAQLATTRPRITMTSYHIGSYIGVSNGRVYLDASVNYASSSYRALREVRFGTLVDQLTVNGTRDGDTWGASAETGYQLRHGKVNIQPFAGLHYRYANVSELRESGGDTALDVAPFKAESLRSSLGMRASTVIVKGRWSLQPSISGEWRHELRGKVASVIEARLVNTDAPVFTLNPDQPGRNAGLVTVGLAATWREHTTLRLSYRGEFADDRRINGFMATISHRI
jgi:uncharacterized protein with beta-barrel porin domain